MRINTGFELVGFGVWSRISDAVPVESTHEVTIDFTKDQGVLLGADDLTADLPLQPSEDLMEMLRRGDLHNVGGTVKAPRVIYNPDPDYSALARKNDFSGVCTLGLIVGSDGRPRSIWLIQPIGYGLDQSAIDAVTRWKLNRLRGTELQSQCWSMSKSNFVMIRLTA